MNIIQRCIENTIYSILPFAKVVPLHEINSTEKMKNCITVLGELLPWNCKSNHKSLYIDMNNKSIFQYSMYIYSGNNIHKLLIFSRVVPFHAKLTLQPSIKLSFLFNPKTVKSIKYHQI